MDIENTTWDLTTIQDVRISGINKLESQDPESQHLKSMTVYLCVSVQVMYFYWFQLQYICNDGSMMDKRQ